jgi:hypothetical protein
MDFLNSNAGAIQAISTVILVLITGVYVWLTRKLANVSASQLQFQKKSENFRLQQEIIDMAVKFIITSNTEIDKLELKKNDYFILKGKYPSDAQELKKKFFSEIDRQIEGKGFMPEIVYISFQLKRLKNIDLWKDLDKIGATYEEMVKVLIKSEDINKYKTIHSKYADQWADFVNKCLDVCKLD